MRNWSLKAGDPLSLVLAADARLGNTDYVNDQIWELEIGTGEPPALALRTTYGLRARSARIFPRFVQGGSAVSDPAAFAVKPEVQQVYPNLLEVSYSPIVGLEVLSEYWAPDSQTVAGRLTLQNVAVVPLKLKLEWTGLLSALEGQNFTPVNFQSVNILSGQTGNLAPVVFLTGGPQAGKGPFPCLVIDLELLPGVARQLTWVHAAQADIQASFDHARRTAARPWEAERARVEMAGASNIVDIHTGDPDWDAAFYLSQKAALGMFLSPGDALPELSFVSSRTPDQGYSRRGDGKDYNHLWNGQAPLEAYYLSSLLPGAASLKRGLLENFLSTQAEDGSVDGKPGLARQRGRSHAAPLLASLAWEIFQTGEGQDWLGSVYQRLLSYFQAWFNPANDRNRDGLPEWANPLQTGFEDNPLFAHWRSDARAVDTTRVVSPALLAGLYREAVCLARMAEKLGKLDQQKMLERQAGMLRTALEKCWDGIRNIYRYLDSDTHLSQAGRELARASGNGQIRIKEKFDAPVRLQVLIRTAGQETRQPELTISEFVTKKEYIEKLTRPAFRWNEGVAVATTQNVFTRVGKVQVRGIASSDEVILRTLDTTWEDVTLLLPLWAGALDETRAETFVSGLLAEGQRFNLPFGVAACAQTDGQDEESICASIHMPWNHLVGQGLLQYGFQAMAAELVARLVAAVIQNLKRSRSFFRSYHGRTGAGQGDRNALAGLAPVGLFLQVLGVEIVSPARVKLSGYNPFPWPVELKYRGLTVIRHREHTDVIFPNGRELTVSDPAPRTISQAD